jgi:hypothetical protein
MSHNRDLSAAAAQIGFHSSNIGIGTDAPSETITLNHANGASIGLEYDGTENGTINVNSAAMYARAGSGKHLILGGNATESLRLTSGGDIGIANASPRAKLDIEDAGTSKDVILRVSADDTNPYALVVANDTFNTTSNRGFAFWVGGNKVHHIEARTSTTNSENEIMISAGDAITFRTNVSEERFRINGDGNIGIGDASPTKPLTVGTTTPVILLDDQSSRTLEIRGPSTTHIASILTTSGHSLLLGTNNSERLRIDADGTLLVNSAKDNTGGHGQIVAHAPTSGNAIYKAIEIGNTNGNGTARGAAICGQPQSNSHLPYTLIGSWDHGDNTDVYYGGGWGGAMRPATRHRFYTNSSYPTSGSSGTEVVRITESGDLGVNTVEPQSKLHVFITKNSGSTGATRTAQHAAMRLSLDKSSGSAPYQGWGPALDFYSDNYDGSTQRPNARIAGVISNYSVGHEGGELRFYTTPTDTATSESDFAQRMTITSAGYVLKTQQPAFFVYKNQGPWSLAAGDTFVFDTVELNVGSHYSTSNGRFTAPITGRYVFHFFSIFTGNATNDYVQMYKNGARMMGGDVHFTNDVGNAWDTVHYSRVIQLSGGDYVYMRSGSAHTYHGNNWGGLSGYLLG